MTAAPQLDFDFTKRPHRKRDAYFNTTHLSGEALATARRDARKQDVLVLSIMRGTVGPLTPSEVWRAGAEAGSDWLLTSTRRSITSLTALGVLQKCEGTRTGPYGRPEHIWKLTEK